MIATGSEGNSGTGAAGPAPDGDDHRPRRLGRILGVLVVVALLLFALPLLLALRGESGPLYLTLLSPADGTNLTGEVEVRWRVSDERNASLPASVSFYYTTDPLPYCPSCPEPQWTSLGPASAGGSEGTYLWNTTALPDGDDYTLKVVVRAGGESAEALATRLIISNGGDGD